MARCSAVKGGRAASRPSPGIRVPRVMNTPAVRTRIARHRMNQVFFIFYAGWRPVVKNAVIVALTMRFTGLA